MRLRTRVLGSIALGAVIRSVAVFAVAGLLLAGIGGSVAGAATSAPRVQAASATGTYTVHVAWSGRGGWVQYSMTLLSDHTGTTSDGSAIVWSTTGRSFTMTLDGGVATYQGTRSKAGFDNLRHPGTSVNNLGRTGVWYAVKTA